MWIFCYPFCYTLPCFFVNFGGLSLPCPLLCCLLFVCLFFVVVVVVVVCFSSFFFLHGFSVFYLHGFSGFFCKFNCSWHFFTSSGHVPQGLGCTAPPFRGRVSKGCKLYN